MKIYIGPQDFLKAKAIFIVADTKRINWELEVRLKFLYLRYKSGHWKN